MIKKIVFTICVILALAYLFCYAEDREPLCYPPYWGGILPGESKYKEVVKIYGRGFSKDLGDGAVVYYFNTGKTHSLTITIGTDNFVADLAVSEGLDLPLGLSESDIPEYISDWFDPDEGFGKWHRLKIGMDKNAALEWLGNPHEKLSEVHWRYYSKCSCELPAGIDLMFNDSKIVKVRFWAAQG